MNQCQSSPLRLYLPSSTLSLSPLSLHPLFSCDVKAMRRMIRATNLFPDLVRMACSVIGSWGPANAPGHDGLIQSRLLDFGAGPFPNASVIIVQHPNEGISILLFISHHIISLSSSSRHLYLLYSFYCSYLSSLLLQSPHFQHFLLLHILSNPRYFIDFLLFFSPFPLLSVSLLCIYPGYPFFSLSFPGFVGVVTGMSSQIALSEKVWMVTGKGLQDGTYEGEAVVMYMRRALQFADNIDTAGKLSLHTSSY